jgi:hypothetical protein
MLAGGSIVGTNQQPVFTITKRSVLAGQLYLYFVFPASVVHR